ncbi:putative protein kinase RLK-Pelle-DLSV family [Helianthus debilis subsp. tardiflorus]
MSSSQGFEEFRNEVVFISRLQHRNLVKTIGYCFEDEPKSKTLDWSIRFHIIDGIARRLLYLHQDSRLRIIHRDLKPANILLDHDMNPKLSDFGLARSFGGNETQRNTKRVAWNLYKEGKHLKTKLVDSSLIESDHTFEVLQSIQVGLLCVQNNPDERPNMSTVVMNL